jgi:hypothetical protein
MLKWWFMAVNFDRERERGNIGDAVRGTTFLLLLHGRGDEYKT